jgi:short-subunit dehydrogenase
VYGSFPRDAGVGQGWAGSQAAINRTSMTERVVITGASSGIGAALARVYAKRGAILGLIARRQAELDALASELGGTVATYGNDVRDGPALAASARDFVARFGTPDVVIANAGVSAGNLTHLDDDIETCQWILDVNVMGIVKTFQPYLGGMLEARRGTLVGIASVAGIRGLPGAGAYSASKAAAIAYLESLRVELRGSGVSVVTIAPGYVATNMTAKNPYRMPFLLPADEAARRFVRAIDARVAYTVIPWPMAIVAKLLGVLPRPLFDHVFAKAKRKPRRSES